MSRDLPEIGAMPSSGCRQRGRASCVHRAETTLKASLIAIAQQSPAAEPSRNFAAQALGCALVGTGRPRSGRPPRGQATTTLRGGDRYPQPSPSPLPPPPLASRADLSEGHAHRYWVTDGLGLFELLTLCELLHSTCQMSIYTGYSMGRRYVPAAQSETFAQDAVDMLDFANAAPASSPWAAVRERMGHAAPFGLSRVEVGNEERDMSGEGYPAHYELITRRLWAAYPSLHIVASGRWGPPIEGSPCLTGQRCDLWDDHYYRPPDVMAAMGGEYDRYNRSLPKVYVGEFAANGATGASSLGPAVGSCRVEPVRSFLRRCEAVLARGARGGHLHDRLRAQRGRCRRFVLRAAVQQRTRHAVPLDAECAIRGLT